MNPGFYAHIKQYVSLNSEEEKILSAAVKIHSLKKKEFLLEEGQVCKCNYFVVKGCLRLFFINEKGIEQITQFAIENWWISDYMSLDKQTPSSFYIQAIELSEVVSLDFSEQKNLFKNISQLESYFRIMSQRSLAAAQIRIKYLYELSKEESFHQFSIYYPEFIQRIPQYMLASYLGFTPEYLSELRNKRKI